jgi:hypothetical protein
VFIVPTAHFILSRWDLHRNLHLPSMRRSGSDAGQVSYRRRLYCSTFCLYCMARMSIFMTAAPAAVSPSALTASGTGSSYRTPSDRSFRPLRPNPPSEHPGLPNFHLVMRATIEPHHGFAARVFSICWQPLPTPVISKSSRKPLRNCYIFLPDVFSHGSALSPRFPSVHRKTLDLIPDESR